MTTRPWSKDIWFSPCYVINELEKTVRTGNQKKIDKAKEAWICAVALICRTKVEPTEWWIQVPEKDPPDLLAMHFVPHAGGKGNSLSQLPVEVFEIREFNNESIEKSIERKLEEKDYSGAMVVGFVRRQQFFDHVVVSNHIKKINPNAGSVFLIVNEENNTNFSFIGIFPDCVKFKADFGAFCKTTNQNDFVDVKRGTIVPPQNRQLTNDIVTMIPERFS